ncbi:glycoside hydrolase family 18 [uncultured Bacteroides sp.]|uniref:glycoside hydrolase family 18 n=1 Tax=uncultured Bacteroides sp. TaxID=162156 RepID=UPI002AA674C2|nr:glycoside hydrolase family 18 [uncultured Bacteroides sp.]
MKIDKNSLRGLIIGSFSVLALSACSDWTDTEAISLDQANITKQNPELYAKYLQNLRKYKESDHKKVYTWFDNTQKVPFSCAHHLTDLPDSIDVVSLMYPDNLADWELNEMGQVRSEKAMKVIYTIDFESIKAAYNSKLELTTEEEPVAEEFLDYLTDSLQYALSLATKYHYDGICIGYAGKSRLHMLPDELKEYTENETAFINIMKDWHKRNPDMLITYEGNPQNLIDPSLLDDCMSILVSGKTATSEDEFTYLLLLADRDDIPQDRFGLTVMSTDLNDPNKQIGYLSDGSLAMAGLAEWASAVHDGIELEAVGIYNVSTDYYTLAQSYYYTRQLISSVNQPIK